MRKWKNGSNEDKLMEVWIRSEWAVWVLIYLEAKIDYPDLLSTLQYPKEGNRCHEI